MAMISKALTLSGKLKPEARLGVALSEFAAALTERDRTRFTAMRAKSSKKAPSAEDVIRMTEELNRDGARLHKTWRPYSTRLGAFLSGLQSLASLGDVVIGGSQNLIACGVWFAVRVCLETAIGFMTYFDKVSALFLKLGTSWALHRDFAQLFPRNHELQTFLAEYLITIVTLCKKVVLFGKKSSLSQFATVLMSSFKTDFDPLLSELDQWARLIEQKANLLSAESTLNAESGAIERSLHLARRLSASGRRQRNFDLKQRLLLQLCPHQPEYDAQWRRQRRKGTCYWIFDTPGYKEWRARASREQHSTALWVSGSLGSGKTVILANVVADIHLQQRCLFAFCSSKNSGSVKGTNIIGSLAYQYFNGIPLEASFWTTINDDELSEKASSTEGVVQLLLAAIPNDESIFIVVDGLEECADDDTTDVLLFLKPLMEARRIHVCCSSRPESVLRSRFSSILQDDQIHSVTLNNQARYEEIKDFIAAEIQRRTADRPLDPNLEILMKSQLVAGAQGMYLWVALQLEAMLPAYYGTVVASADIYDILQNLPKDLPAAFDQALSRIRERKYRNQLFKLVATAERPLAIDEMRVALTVVPGQTTWHPEKLPPDGIAIVHQCGGNLVEIDEEDEKIHFIHHSVLLHLIQPSTGPETALFHFSLDDAHIEMGCICLAYLCYGIFDNRVGIQRKVDTSQVGDTILKATAASSPVLAKIAQHVAHRPNRRSTSLDIGRIAQELLTLKLKQQQQDVPSCFLPYARTFWLDHTKQFEVAMDSRIWSCWKLLVEGEMQHVKVPWNPARDGETILRWALQHCHGALFQYVLHGNLRSLDDMYKLITQHTGNDPHRLGIGGRWLDDILAQFLEFDKVWDLDVIKFFLDAGASPMRTHHRTGMSPLQILLTKPWISARRREAVGHCIITSESVRDWARRSNLRDLITTTIVKGYEGIALDLIRLDSPITFRQITTGDSPLGSAVALGLRNLIPELLRKGAHPAMSYYAGKPALQIALESQAEDIIEIMVQRQSDVVNSLTTQGPTMLCAAISKTRHKMVALLLKLGADPNLASGGSQGEYAPLFLAIKREDIRTVRLLLDHGASKTFSGIHGNKTALHTALQLFSTGDPRSWIQRAAIIDLFCSDKEQLSTFNMNRLDETGNGVLHYAVQVGFLWIRPFLEVPGIDVNLANSNGDTALHYAVSRLARGQSDTMENTLKSLLTAEAGPNLPNSQRITPLEIAVTCKDNHVLEGLVEHGGDPKITTSSGSTLLHIAVERNNTQSVEFLLQSEVVASRKDTNGLTPLDIGIQRGSIESVQVLLKNPTCLAALLAHETTVSPLLRALEGIHNKTSNASMVSILLRAGADPNWREPKSGEPILTSFLRHVTDGPPSDISRHVFRRKKDEALSSFRDLKNELIDSAMALISSGADPNILIEEGLSLLDHAIRRDWAKIALHLLENGADPDGVPRTPSGKVLSAVNGQRALISRDDKSLWDEIKNRLGCSDILRGNLDGESEGLVFKPFKSYWF